MPKIYDNKHTSFLSGLTDALGRSYRSDICTAYFNLRGWKKIANFIDKYSGEEDHQCRLLLGMYNSDNEFKKELIQEESRRIDNKKAKKLREQTVKNFRNQLMRGIPSNEDEKNLRKLASQLKSKKVIVKCFTRHPLHAKLYLTFNKSEFAKKVGFLGSSNLTYAGLEKNGELNIDVLDQQSCKNLSQWFEEKWQDQFSLDISDRVIDLIEESWAGEDLILPYHIYMKMAYHLSEDARKGLTDFFIPKELQKVLFNFQSAAVRIATHYLYHKNGVLLGDVVGLGKTLMAITVAKILEEERGWQSLILCPRNLKQMWDDYIQKWCIRGRVIPISQVQSKLLQLQRHHIVIIDESHNLRNPLGKRYQVIKDYIAQNDSKCILLSATPYNKMYTDLSSQLGLFIDLDADLGVRPNKFLLSKAGYFEGLTSSLKAFEQSPYSEDWQQLMSQFLVRRTRSFIKENYGEKDNNGRYYLKGSDDKKFFPERIAKTVKYKVHEQYKRFFSPEVVDMINSLKLARYGLAGYKKPNLAGLTQEEEKLFKDLEQSRAHPKGFCRIGLFKRLESSGFAFLKSVQRHILRNCIFIYAIDRKEKLIVREKSSEIIASAFDNDEEGGITGYADEYEEDAYFLADFQLFYEKAKEVYTTYQERNSRSLKWISSSYFIDQLKKDLQEDTEQLIDLLKKSKNWNPEKDLKMKKIEELLKSELKGKKTLIFTQFRETAEYLQSQLQKRNLKNITLITGKTDNIQNTVNKFSPHSNNFNITKSQDSEIDILITTDVLSEGQNLQDCNIVINYDLPWAIIKLIQRVGRIDRIGQKSDRILCYSFMPDDGLEEQIRLRSRIQNRLKENAEVIGTDEQFFENEKQMLIDLYNEKSKTLEKEILEDIDLSSFALEIWNKGIKKDSSLEEKIKSMPDVVHASKEVKHKESEEVLLFAKSHINNYLLCLDKEGKSVTENQMAILKKAECQPNTRPLQRTEKHYEIVRSGLNTIAENLKHLSSKSGRLGTSRNPRRKLFEKLDGMNDKSMEIEQIMEDLYHYPLSNEAEHTLKRMFRRKISDKEIFKFVCEKHRNETLMNKKESKRMDEKPRIVCSMGLVK